MCFVFCYHLCGEIKYIYKKWARPRVREDPEISGSRLIFLQRPKVATSRLGGRWALPRISLITIPTAPYSVMNCPHYFTSPPVLFRGCHWTSRVRRHCRRPCRRCAGELNVQVRRRHAHHHAGQQRDAARGAHQRAEMGCAKQPQADCSKSTEVIFRDHRRRRHHAPAAAERPEPAPLPGIARSSCLKMLDVSIENIFSIAQHVKRLVTARAQSVYALRVLRLVGWTTTLCSTSTVPYHRRRSSDVRRQRVARSHQSATPQAHRLCAGSRSTPRVCPADLPTLDELCNIADDELFGRSMRLSITMSSTH